jgi:hypothetical protein
MLAESTEAISFMFKRMLLIVSIQLLFSLPALAQRSIDFGAKIGLPTSNTLKGYLTGNFGAFNRRSFDSSSPIGPTVGVSLFKNIDVRFEALYRRASYTATTQLPGSPSTSRKINGHSWEFPLLGSYRFNVPKINPYVGGGMTLGSTINTAGVTHPDGMAWILNGGFEHQFGHLSLRGEVRHTHWYDDSTPNSIFRAPQMDFLLGIALRR